MLPSISSPLTSGVLSEFFDELITEEEITRFVKMLTIKLFVLGAPI